MPATALPIFHQASASIGGCGGPGQDELDVMLFSSGLRVLQSCAIVVEAIGIVVGAIALIQAMRADGGHRTGAFLKRSGWAVLLGVLAGFLLNAASAPVAMRDVVAITQALETQHTGVIVSYNFVAGSPAGLVVGIVLLALGGLWPQTPEETVPTT